MRIKARTTRPAAAVVGIVLLAGLTTVAAGGSAAGAEPGAPAAESCGEAQDPPAQLPPGVEDGDLLFVTKSHPVLVDVTCGRLDLVELTGWDSCYFLHEDTVIRYPC